MRRLRYLHPAGQAAKKGIPFEPACDGLDEGDPKVARRAYYGTQHVYERQFSELIAKKTTKT